jgi:hypothetical protein
MRNRLQLRGIISDESQNLFSAVAERRSFSGTAWRSLSG